MIAHAQLGNYAEAFKAVDDGLNALPKNNSLAGESKKLQNRLNKVNRCIFVRWNVKIHRTRGPRTWSSFSPRVVRDYHAIIN